MLQIKRHILRDTVETTLISKSSISWGDRQASTKFQGNIIIAVINAKQVEKEVKNNNKNSLCSLLFDFKNMVCQSGLIFTGYIEISQQEKVKKHIYSREYFMCKDTDMLEFTGFHLLNSRDRKLKSTGGKKRYLSKDT